jgi:hypothetical protein
MLHPPFARVATSFAAVSHGGTMPASDRAQASGERARPTVALAADPGGPGRRRLAELDPHLFCSIIGTCLGTSELRKLMSRFLAVDALSDLEVHHESVSRAAGGGAVAKALNKALDQRHAAAVQRFGRARGAAALETLWAEAAARGQIAGAYWALLSHRDTTAELRQKVFGEVHMLSHLVGASHRANLRRLAALESENAELRERLDEQRSRGAAQLAQRDARIGTLQIEVRQARLEGARSGASAPEAVGPPKDAEAEAIALHTGRRERAEQLAEVALAEADRLRAGVEEYARHVQVLQRELAAAEAQLRALGDPDACADRRLDEALSGRRLLYVGGRPSSTPVIRDLVERHGGEFRHHDGGLADRKGLLASSIAWAHLVVFPVDCVDHDSAGNLKRLCARLDIPFVPMRSASIACFAATLAGRAEIEAAEGPRSCLRHG